MVELLVTAEFMIVFFMISLYFLAVLYIIKRLASSCGTTPIYERSKRLVFLANLSNYLETIFNAITGYIFIKEGSKISNELIPYNTLGVFFARFYASCMGMRTYHILILNEYRKGNLSISSVRKHRSFKTTIIINFLYSLSMTLIFIIIILVSGQNQENTDIYYKLSYGFESLTFALSLYIVAKASLHPTILVEYIFYSFIWSTGMFNFNMHFGDRWYYTVPIRNTILLNISLVSMAEHCNSIRPPLPMDPKIDNIFEVKEMFYNFKKFVSENCDDVTIESCYLYKDCIFFFLGFCRI
ncbi:hypothetical protein SteCoe_27501 [Stentor coeruleus]|uniref:Serpentine receptor class gamma n=1 Tax=Stentor coeruleus TaxID=5963 RepID=A0A1R2BAH8_9CILI|nr:hypothetical protein SteCoe_27501 [Stentor coeruleus]